MNSLLSGECTLSPHLALRPLMTRPPPCRCWRRGLRDVLVARRQALQAAGVLDHGPDRGQAGLRQSRRAERDGADARVTQGDEDLQLAVGFLGGDLVGEV